jgi:hypothetical protein
MPGTAQLSQASPQLTTTVTVEPVSDRIAELTAREPELWSAADLSLFITEEIARHAGPQLPCAQAQAILEQFWARYGARGVLIARRVFEVHRGFWLGAPVTVRRFEPGQDEYFAGRLLDEIAAE